jgi:hypothetical protein
MARDGKIYTGTAEGNGFGSGSMTVTIDDKTYTGPMVRTAINSEFASGGGTVQAEALLSTSDGHGLRCHLTGDGAGHGGGVCVDDGKRTYDVILR